MSLIEQKIVPAILRRIRARRKASTAALVTATDLPPAKLRPALFSDFEAVAQLKRRWEMDADSLENWERLWRHNPALAHAPKDRPIGWVLEAGGTLAGYLGNISLSYHFGDKAISAVTGHGLVVEPGYRAQAATLMAAFYRQKGVDLYLGTSAVPEVNRIARAFKADALPQADYDKVFFWVLRPYVFARGLVDRVGILPAFAGAVAASVSIAMRMDAWLRRRFPQPNPTGFQMSEITVEEIDTDFEYFWTEKLREDQRMLADRSPASLRWHFEIPGDPGSARVLCCRKDGKLRGYAVIRHDLEAGGRQKSRVADLLALHNDVEVVKALIVSAYNHAKRSGSYILELMGFPSSIRRVCSQWNPYVRSYPESPFHYKAADANLHAVLSDGAAWYASPFDGDATLIGPSFSRGHSVTADELGVPRDVSNASAEGLDETPILTSLPTN
jgi:hypothetical protein